MAEIFSHAVRNREGFPESLICNLLELLCQFWLKALIHDIRRYST
jgi:hypothetical protein